MKEKLTKHQLITANLSSRIAESYRVLRTNIQFASIDNPIKKLLITSTAPGEGKSTTAANLAVAFAQTGSSVVVVDCDLRRPTQHKVFGISNPLGVTNLLLQTVDLSVALRDSGVPGLKIITSGPLPPNPAEMLGSKRMAELLSQLAQQFDYVLIDSPPVLAVTDASVLSSVVDGVVLVVSPNNISTDKAQKAKEQLVSVKAKILGVVLNGLEQSTKDEEYYHYYKAGK